MPRSFGYRHLGTNSGVSAADRNTLKAPIGGTLGGTTYMRFVDRLPRTNDLIGGRPHQATLPSLT